MNSLKLLLLAPLLFTLSACVTPPVTGRPDPYARPQVTFASGRLKRMTTVGAANATRKDNSDILFVTVPIRSTIDTPFTIEYRVSFFDSTGQPLNQTTWYSKELEPNIPDQVTVNSLGPRARQFQVDFREAR